MSTMYEWTQSQNGFPNLARSHGPVNLHNFHATLLLQKLPTTTLWHLHEEFKRSIKN